MSQVLAQLLDAFPFPTAVVVSQGGTVLAAAGQVDAIFPLASVTKPLVAYSALIAVERALLRLDQPADVDLLPGANVEHLLAHCSGVAFASNAVLAPPATRRIYSNRGIEILGERLSEATGVCVEEWVETVVFQPLGMSTATIPASPAHSGQASAADLSIFARELAAPTLISASLAARAFAPVCAELEGVLPGYGRQSPNPFGLGVEIRGHKHPHWTGANNSAQTFGHFGQSGSFIWVDPVAQRQAVFLGAEPFGAIHRKLWPQLNDQILALP